jgi:hypothetical protein
MMRRSFELVCDECLADQDQHFWHAETARVMARLDGWKRRGKRDLCPECAGRQAGLDAKTDM